MTTATITTRIDAKDKTAFESFCTSVGMNTSTAVNLFIKTVIRKQKIPFAIENDPFYSEENQTVLASSLKELREGKGKSHPLLEDEA